MYVILDPFEYRVKYLSRYSKGSRMTLLIPVPKTKNILNIIRRLTLIILSMFLVLGTGINVSFWTPSNIDLNI